MGQDLKKTALHALHRQAGAKMVGFAGWEMPVSYRGVIEEHLAVRRCAGLFDVSHMGEIEVRGGGALEFCQLMTANDVSRMKVSQAQYNLLLNENGGVVDDVVFYRLEPDRFLICVNAVNSVKDFEWLQRHASADVAVEHVSHRYAQLALQGPRAETILQRLTELTLGEIKSFHFRWGAVASAHCLVSRTGYTGEDGFELYCQAEASPALWQALLEAGGDEGLLPAGLGARDTLRLEQGFPLYGHELDETTTPLEARLEWVVKWSKPSFMGREILLQQKSNGLSRVLIGLELLEPGIARMDYPILCNEHTVGRVTSGTKSPTLGKSVALGYVSREAAEVGDNIAVEIRGRRTRAKIVQVPFLRN